MPLKPTLYNAWFCPFAQRAWIALLEKGVDFEYHETDPYNKTPEFLAINPRGLVPVIVHNAKCVYESSICIEYVDEAFDLPQRLLPTDPYQRAYVRIWSDFIAKKIVPPFYSVLLKQSPEDQEIAKKAILTGVETIVEQMSDDGPFFMGADFGMVDIMLAPFVIRFEVLKHYRHFELPKDAAYLARFKQWWSFVQERPSVKKTLQDNQKLLNIYQRYAYDTAETEVATSIRSGTSLP